MNEDGILCTREEDLLPIKDYDDWRIPFIGRRVKENFWEKFQKQDDLLKDDQEPEVSKAKEEVKG